MTEKQAKPKKRVKPLVPEGPPTWTEAPQIPPDILKEVEEELAKKAESKQTKKGKS